MKRATLPLGTLLIAIFALCAMLSLFGDRHEAAAEHVDKHEGNEPYVLKPGIIVKNVLLGLSIDVCSSSHPKATAAAVRVWNMGTSRYVDVPLFTFRGSAENCATTDNEKLASILVKWHRTCGRSDRVIIACTDNGPVHKTEPTYTNQTQIRMLHGNDNARGTEFNRVVIDVAHELGHALGLAHYYCTSQIQDAVGGDRLLVDQRAVMNGETKEPERDEETGELKPNGRDCIVRGEPQLTAVDVADFMRAYHGEPKAPSELEAIPGDGRITWRWDKAADDPAIDHYEFRVAGGPWRRIVGSDAETTSHLLVDLSNEIAYAAEFRAVRGHVRGGASSVVATPTAFVAPVIASFEAIAGRLVGTFTWAGTAPRMLKWELRRSPIKDGDYSQIAATKEVSTSPVGFDNQTVGFWYKLRGRACETRTDPGAQQSGVSGQQAQPFEICGDWREYPDPVELTPLGICRRVSPGVAGAGGSLQRTACIPPQPSGLTVTDVTNTSAKLKWKASAGATDYAVRLDGVVVDESIGNVSEYSFGGLTAKTAHVLSVAAKNANAQSGFAKLTLLVPPSSLSAAATHNSIRLTWAVDTNATAADVRLGAAGSVKDADERTSHTFDQNISPSTRYTLYVRARNTRGTSAWAQTTATTTAGQCPSPRPPKPAANGYRPLGTATTWAEPSGGKTAELESEERQPQTRSVTWNAVECHWDAGEWGDVGDSYWTTPARTGVTRPAPAKPSSNGYRPLGTATTWAEPSGGKTAELESEERQPQTRSVTWNAVECRWDAGKWADVGDTYWTTPARTGVTRPAPAKPAASGYRPLGTATTWAQPSGGKTAELESEERQPQTRSVTWNAVECRWDAGKWADVGDTYWTTPSPTGDTRTAPAEPAASGYRPLGTATTWAEPSGGKTAELESEERQPQTRSVTWNAVECRWDAGRWGDAGDTYWTTPSPTGETRPAPAKPAANGYRPLGTATTWAEPSGGKTAELESEERQPQTRSVTWNAAECQWDAGEWGDVDNSYWTTPSPTGETRTAPAKPIERELRDRKTESRSEVRGTTAYKQSRQVATQHRRTVSWDESDGSWNPGDWDNGVPWSTPWKDTGEEIERPPTRTWTTRVNEARTGRTRVIRVQTTPICLEQTQEQLRYRIRYSAQAYVWDGDMSWVPGTVTSTTPPVWHTRWRDVGSQRLCRIGGQEDEAAAADAGPSFEAGQHTLQWGTVWLRFTVPAGSSVLLTARADATRELTAVFSLAGGAELVVSPSALARDEHPTSTDTTLASLAASLALVEEPQVASAQSGDTACATATPGAPSTATRVDLDANDCTLISGGGSVVLVAGKASLNLTLPDGREWIAFAAPVAQGNGSDAFWLIDAASGSLIVLDPASGNELARQLTDGSDQLKGLLDGIAASADD